MKRLFFCLMILAVWVMPVQADYSFTFVCRSDTLQQVVPGGVAVYYFTLSNTGTEPDVYLFDCRVLQEVAGWSAIYCLRGRCVEPGVPMFDSLAPGEVDTTIDITVFTTNTEGEEVIQMTVTSQGDPSQVSSIKTYTRVSCGVEEGVTYLERKPLPGLMFDYAGRRVRTVLTPGVYFVRQDSGVGFKKVVVLR